MTKLTKKQIKAKLDEALAKMLVEKLVELAEGIVVEGKIKNKLIAAQDAVLVNKLKKAQRKAKTRARDRMDKYQKHSSLGEDQGDADQKGPMKVGGPRDSEEDEQEDEKKYLKTESSLTRKHFIAKADELKASKATMGAAAHKAAAHSHADAFAKKNPRFDRAKFLAHAGVNESFSGHLVRAYKDGKLAHSSTHETAHEAKKALQATKKTHADHYIYHHSPRGVMLDKHAPGK